MEGSILEYKNIHLKRVLLLSSLLGTSFTLAGCGNQYDEDYNNAIQSGLDALVVEDFDRAEVFFEVATKEKPDEEKSKELLSQTVAYNHAMESFEVGNLKIATENAKKVMTLTNGSDDLVEKSTNLLKKIEEINKLSSNYQAIYNEVVILSKEGNVKKALAKIDELLQEDKINDDYYSSIRETSEELKMSIENTQSAEKAQAEAESVNDSTQGLEGMASDDEDNNQERLQLEEFLTIAEESINSSDQSSAWRLLIQSDIGVEEIQNYPDLKKKAYDLALQLDGHEMYIDYIENTFN